MFNSAVVEVTPSRMFISAVVEVTPSSMFNSAAVELTPRVTNWAAALASSNSAFPAAVRS